MVNFSCLECGYARSLANELAARSVICPKCKAKGRVDPLAAEALPRDELVVDAELVENSLTLSNSSNQKIEFEMVGVQDTLRVFRDRISIAPRGVLGFLNKGLLGTKEIPYRSITAIQAKEAGPMLNGFLQFSISGGSGGKDGFLATVSEENTFRFRGSENNALAAQIKGFIQYEIDRLHSAQQTSRVPSISEELSRLAALRSEGILSDDEFSLLKKRLLS